MRQLKMSPWPNTGGLGLASFFQARPHLAAPLAGGLSPGVFLAKMDRLIRAGSITDEMQNMVTAMQAILQSSDREFFIDNLIAEAMAATRSRVAIRSLRSLWGTTPINNIVPCALADRLLGVEAETVVWTTYHITSKFDVVLKPFEDWSVEQAPELLVPLRWLVFVWALLTYDIFFYFNDRGLLQPGNYASNRFGIDVEEMKILRLSGKAFYTLAYGSDHRSREKTMAEGRYNFCMHCPEIGKHCLCDDTAAERILTKIAVHTNAMLGAGLSLKQLPGARRMDYLIIDVNRVVPMRRARREGPLRIVHVPNHPFFKGTQYLQSGVETLRQEGIPIELIMVSGVPNEEALSLMADADIVADQFISGCFGYTAIEAMALGKPVLCYVRHDIDLPDRDYLPIINTNPDHLTRTLRHLVKRRSELETIGRQSREYVEANYSIEAFALRLRDLYKETSVFGEAIREKSLEFRVHRERMTRVARARSGFGLRLRVRVRRIVRKVRQLSASIERDIRSKARETNWQGSVVRSLIRVLRPIRNPRLLPRAAYRCLLTVLMPVSWVLCLCGRALRPGFAGMLVMSARGMTTWRLRRGKPRSLWGTTPILTLPLLCSCDKKLGFRSESLVFVTYHITRNFDIDLSRLQSWILRFCPSAYGLFTKCVLVIALLRYDVFHFFCDRGILSPRGRIGINPAELDLLKRCGKRLYTYTYGADVRTREATLALGQYNACIHCPEPGRYCQCEDRAGQNNIAVIRQYATAMIAMGDMVTYVPECRRMPFWPIDTERISYIGVKSGSERPLRVAHAPNHPEFKGTVYLEDAIERLTREGFRIEMVRIQGVPNEVVLRTLGEVDIVADQFIIGFHGYTALEAMARGKPVLCYMRQEWIEYSAACPIINVSPDQLYTVLRSIASGEMDLPAIGEASRRYVEQYHSLQAVTKRLAALYRETLMAPDPFSRCLAMVAGHE